MKIIKHMKEVLQQEDGDPRDLKDMSKTDG